jgi:hypothetical protein
MATRRPTPDILGGPPTPDDPGTLAHQRASAPDQTTPRAPVEPPVERVKATFYLHPEVLECLEDAWYQLRKFAKGTERGKVSKSLIVEVALQLALQDLEGQGEASQLASKMVHP